MAAKLFRRLAQLVPHVPGFRSIFDYDGPALAFDFEAHLARQSAWSACTFGPGTRAKGVVAHIRKELIEIEADPTDLIEWIDVVILALDGAWRSGATPRQIIEALAGKQERNELRQWPDWRSASEDEPIEHTAEGTPDGAR